MKTKFWKYSAALLAFASVLIMSRALRAQNSMGSAKSGQSSMAASNSMPTDSQIANARAKGMVWVNTSTKVYHKDDQFYGKTKHGQFMTEADAQKMGAHPAKPSMVGKKPAANGTMATQH